MLMFLDISKHICFNDSGSIVHKIKWRMIVIYAQILIVVHLTFQCKIFHFVFFFVKRKLKLEIEKVIEIDIEKYVCLSKLFKLT